MLLKIKELKDLLAEDGIVLPIGMNETAMKKSLAKIIQFIKFQRLQIDSLEEKIRKLELKAATHNEVDPGDFH